MCNRHSDHSGVPQGESASARPIESSPPPADSALSDGYPPRGIGTRVVERAILFYRRRISSLKPTSTCRFEPTCSAYGLEAVRRFGAARGLWLATLRILRCAPWHPGGWDPVPREFPGLGSWWRRMHR